MSINNPLSKTHFKVTADRLQHYTNDEYTCAKCGQRYHPKVHSQPYIVQFGAALIGLSLYLVFLLQAPPWLYGLLPVLLGGYMLWYNNHDRKIASTDGSRRIRYGEIILDCPACHSSTATKSTNEN